MVKSLTVVVVTATLVTAGCRSHTGRPTRGLPHPPWFPQPPRVPARMPHANKYFSDSHTIFGPQSSPTTARGHRKVDLAISGGRQLPTKA